MTMDSWACDEECHYREPDLFIKLLKYYNTNKMLRRAIIVVKLFYDMYAVANSMKINLCVYVKLDIVSFNSYVTLTTKA